MTDKSDYGDYLRERAKDRKAEIKRLKALPAEELARRFPHSGNPCVFCETHHDNVKPGYCEEHLQSQVIY